jgi:hypothetical protein
MTKSQVTFLFRSFDLQLGIVDSYQSLKKMVRDVTKLPTALGEKLGTNSIMDSLKVAMESKQPLQNTVESFQKWAAKMLSEIEALPDDMFGGKRGPKGAGKEFDLFGEKGSVNAHAARLIAGSKIAEILTGGIPADFTTADYANLQKVVNKLAQQVRNAIPAEAQASIKAERAKAKAEKESKGTEKKTK